MTVAQTPTVDPELASSYKISDYRRDEQGRNSNGIADAVHRRFQERYLIPISPPSVHGFTKMAVACLMIEALESFRRGWLDTRGAKSEHAFCSFFDAHQQFAPLRGHARDFYKGVRCGILHQAETTLGWRIRRDNPSLLDQTGNIRTINATKLVEALGSALDQYRDELKAAAWDSDLWMSLRSKMTSVCKNCDV
jgi:hypothetical protein